MSAFHQYHAWRTEEITYFPRHTLQESISFFYFGNFLLLAHRICQNFCSNFLTHCLARMLIIKADHSVRSANLQRLIPSGCAHSEHKHLFVIQYVTFNMELHYGCLGQLWHFSYVYLSLRSQYIQLPREVMSLPLNTMQKKVRFHSNSCKWRRRKVLFSQDKGWLLEIWTNFDAKPSPHILSKSATVCNS